MLRSIWLSLSLVHRFQISAHFKTNQPRSHRLEHSKSMEKNSFLLLCQFFSKFSAVHKLLTVYYLPGPSTRSHLTLQSNYLCLLVSLVALCVFLWEFAYPFIYKWVLWSIPSIFTDIPLTLSEALEVTPTTTLIHHVAMSFPLATLVIMSLFVLLPIMLAHGFCIVISIGILKRKNIHLPACISFLIIDPFHSSS